MSLATVRTQVELRLESLAGDADLYVSSRVTHPTYFLHEHEFAVGLPFTDGRRGREEGWMQATSCGPDALRILASVPRPLHLGVYGHPSGGDAAFRLTIRLAAPAAAEDPDGPAPAGDPEEEEGDDEEPATIGQLIGSILFFFLQVIVEVLT